MPEDAGGCGSAFFLDALVTGGPVQCFPGRSLHSLPWRRPPRRSGPRFVDETGGKEQGTPAGISHEVLVMRRRTPTPQVRYESNARSPTDRARTAPLHLTDPHE
jgi:hypothetical protein